MSTIFDARMLVKDEVQGCALSPERLPPGAHLSARIAMSSAITTARGTAYQEQLEDISSLHRDSSSRRSSASIACRAARASTRSSSRFRWRLSVARHRAGQAACWRPASVRPHPGHSRSVPLGSARAALGDDFGIGSCTDTWISPYRAWNRVFARASAWGSVTSLARLDRPSRCGTGMRRGVVGS